MYRRSTLEPRREMYRRRRDEGDCSRANGDRREMMAPSCSNRRSSIVARCLPRSSRSRVRATRRQAIARFLRVSCADGDGRGGRGTADSQSALGKQGFVN
ncbi:unnamed protein product [Linum trigynum]|uniref:Uncharacterized protein n=1 Tax=Linum trigynum TaxID=586398 RepID=A0AAV2DNA3_9ROSI